MGVHEDLKKSVGAVKAATKNSPLHFAYVAKGSDGALMVSRGNVSGGVIAAAKKEIGGATVFNGKCFMENGALVLETAGNPAASLATGVRSCLAKHAGLTMQVNARAAGAGEEEEEEASAQEPQEESAHGARGNAPPPGHQNEEEEGNEQESQEQPRGQGGSSKPTAHTTNGPSQGNDRQAEEEEQDEAESNEKVKIGAMVKAIQPRLQAALKGGQGGNAAKVHFDKAASLYRANEFEEAEEELEELDKVLKRLGK